MELDYTEGHDIAVFRTIDELIEKCHYYLTHEDERKQIADNAYKTAHTRCRWDNRCEELIEVLKKYEDAPVPVFEKPVFVATDFAAAHYAKQAAV